MNLTISALLAVSLLTACATIPDENQRIIEQLRSYGLDSREIDRGVLIVLPDGYFEFDKHDLTLNARSKLQAASQTLNAPIVGDRRIAIEGHTDSIGTEAYNLELSFKRSSTVERELIFSNVSEKRMTVKGVGETRPAVPNTNADGTDNPEGRAINRRVEIIILNPNEQ